MKKVLFALVIALTLIGATVYVASVTSAPAAACNGGGGKGC